MEKENTSFLSRFLQLFESYQLITRELNALLLRKTSNTMLLPLEIYIAIMNK
jgi:hypothetical protein